ncbi:MAG: Leptospira repeat protein [Bacteroidetes bacterium]|nr:Leptospira repeat protein [Bacteroidota bacterium]
MKKILSIFLILIVFVQISKAQEDTLIQKLKIQYDSLLSESEGFIGVIKDGKLGYMDRAEIMHIRPNIKFESNILTIENIMLFQPYMYSGGACIIWVNGEFRLMDKLGKYVFGDTVKIVGKSNNTVILKRDGKYAMYSCFGSKKTEFIYDKIQDLLYSDLYLFTKDNKCGLISGEGKIIYEALFDSISIYKSPFGIYVKGKYKNSKTAIITTEGRVVFQPYYEDAYVLEGDFIITKEKGKYGIATRYGKGILHPEFDTVKTLIKNDTFFVASMKDKNMVFNTNSKLVKYFDNDTTIIYQVDTIAPHPFAWIIEPNAEIVKHIGSDTYYGRRAEKAFLLNSNQKEIKSKQIKNIDTKSIIAFDMQRILFKKDTLIGMADYEGNIIKEPQFKDARIVINDETYSVKSDEGWSLMDKTGKILTYSKYETISITQSKGKQYIKAINKDNKTSLFTSAGKLLFQPYYSDIEFTNYNGFYSQIENGGRGIMNSQGRVYVNPVYDDARVIIAKDTFFVARVNNRYTVFNTKKIIIYDGLNPVLDIQGDNTLILITQSGVVSTKIVNNKPSKDFKPIKDAKYLEYSLVFDSLLLVKDQKGWTYADKYTFRPITTKRYFYISPMVNGYAFVVENEKLNVIDKNFNTIFSVIDKGSTNTELQAIARILYASYLNQKDYEIVKNGNKYGIIRLKIIKDIL